MKYILLLTFIFISNPCFAYEFTCIFKAFQQTDPVPMFLEGLENIEGLTKPVIFDKSGRAKLSFVEDLSMNHNIKKYVIKTDIEFFRDVNDPNKYSYRIKYKRNKPKTFEVSKKGVFLNTRNETMLFAEQWAFNVKEPYASRVNRLIENSLDHDTYMDDGLVVSIDEIRSNSNGSYASVRESAIPNSELIEDPKLGKPLLFRVGIWCHRPIVTHETELYDRSRVVAPNE